MTTALAFALLFLIAINAVMFAILRYWDRRGILPALGFQVSRDRSPRAFSLVIGFGWFTLALCVLFSTLFAWAILK